MNCEYLRWWLENSNNKFIPPDGKGHPQKCHSPLHAGHYSDISRFYTVIFWYNSCHHPWPKTNTGWKDLMSDHKLKFLIHFVNQWLWSSPLIFAWHSNSWSWFCAGMDLYIPAQLFPSALITLFLSSQRILCYLHSLSLVSKQENYYYYYFLNRDTWKLLLKPYFLLFKTYYNLETARNILKLK